MDRDDAKDAELTALRSRCERLERAMKEVAAELDEEADNISPTNGVHPAPWMRKRAKRLRAALRASSGGLK